MTSENAVGRPASGTMVCEAEGLLSLVVEEITAAMARIRSGELGDLKDATRSLRDLRQALQIVFEERAKIAKLGIWEDGSGGAYDLGAARDEIGSRLARLRDAGGCG